MWGLPPPPLSLFFHDSTENETAQPLSLAHFASTWGAGQWAEASDEPKVHTPKMAATTRTAASASRYRARGPRRAKACIPTTPVLPHGGSAATDQPGGAPPRPPWHELGAGFALTPRRAEATN